MQTDIRDPQATLDVLLEISKAVNSVSSLDKLYLSIHKSLGRLLNVDNIFIAIYHEEKDAITFQYFRDEKNKNFHEIFNIKAKTSLTANVINTQKPLIAKQDDFLRIGGPQNDSNDTPSKVWIGAPLKIRGRTFGVLALQSYTSQDTYKESDLSILSSVSEFIAIAIDRKQAETAHKKSEDINYALFEISRAINTSISSGQLFDSIYSSLKKIINVNNFYIALYDSESNAITFPFHFDECDDLTEWDVSYLKPDSLTHEVIAGKKPLFLKEEQLKQKARDRKIVGTTPLIWLGVPLIFHDNPIGIMVVQSYTDPNAYSDYHVEILSAVSEQIATAIERIAYEEALKRSEKINKVLYTVSNAVTTTYDLNELYGSIHASLGQVIDLTNFIIGLYDPLEKNLFWGYYADQFDDLQGKSTLLDNKGSFGREVILSGKPVFLTESQINDRIKKQAAIGTLPKIWMGVPLKIEDRVIGYIATQSYTEPKLFNQRDLEVFQAVSGQVATAIERKRAEESERRNKQINRVMFAIANAVNTTQDLDALYRSIHSILGGVIDVTNFIIGIYDKKNDVITYPYYIDEKGDTYTEIKNVSQSGIKAGEVIRLAKPFITNRVQTEERLKKSGVQQFGTKSEQWVGVPLKIKNEVIGVMVVQSYSNPELYSSNDVEIMLAVSDQIAIAIDRKREEQARKKSELLNKAFFEISNAVNTTKDLKDLSKSIHCSLKKITNVENFTITLYDKLKDRLNFLYRRDQADLVVTNFNNVSQSSSLIFETIRRGKTLLLSEAEQKQLVKKLGGNLIGKWAKSWLCIPMMINEETSGALLTQNYMLEGCYKESDIELLEMASVQIASAIEKKQAEDSEKRSKAINRVMFTISNAVNINENFDELYRSIHESLGSIIDVTNFMIGLYDEKRDTITYPYYRDEQSQYFNEIKNVRTSGLVASEVITRAKPFFIDKQGIIERSRRMGRKIIGDVCEQWLGIPLKIKKKVIGVIAVQSYTNPELYSDDDVDILLAVSDQIAMAIERKQAQENIKSNEKFTRTLFRISNAVNTTDNLNELYSSIYDSLNDLIDLPNFFIATLDQGGRDMYFPFYKDEYDTSDPLEFTVPDFRKTPSITTDVINSKRPVFLRKEDLKKMAARNHIYGTIPVIWLGVPLLIRDHVIGVIAVQHYSDPDYFTQRDMDLFIAVSDQVALAIERKQSQQIIIEHKENLQKMVEERTRELTLEIAERIEIEKKLKKAKIEAEAAANAKGQFLANMSHEIRTPINGIMGMAEIALENELHTDLYKLIKAIDDEAIALMDIVNQVLDFSKIEAGRLEIESIPFDLRNTFETTCSSLAIGMENKGIDYITYLAPDVPSKVIGDPVRFRQILLNLAGNAMKFTHQGEVFIKGEALETTTEKVILKFTVKDTGIGIDKVKQASIFSSFIQADGSTTRKYGGTGLGTTISKQLVELMGGKIGLESKAGKGTTFWYTLSFSVQKSLDNAKKKHAIKLKGLKILVADDHPTNRFVLLEYLKALKIDPIIAGDTDKVMDTLGHAYSQYGKIDGIIINLKSSSERSFRLASVIRRDRLFSKLPIIMLTSSGKRGDGQTCKDIGIDAYLLKPVKKDELELALGKSIFNIQTRDHTRKERQLITRHSIAETLTDSPRILLAEDYPTNQQIALRHLKDAGYRTTLAQNGKEAVDLFKTKRFDLILMDIQMPVMDGHKATKKIREIESQISGLSAEAAPKTSKPIPRVPIIAMTAHAIAGYREKCLETGMDDYLSKPLRRKKFLEMVKKWTDAGKTSPQNDKQPEAEPRQKKASEPKPQRLITAPIDFDKALEEFGNDRDFLMEVIEEFIANLENQIPLIRDAIQANDAQIVKKEAHAIKGGASNLTADVLSHFAHDLEKVGGSNSLEQAENLFQRLLFEFARFKDYVVSLTA